MLRSESAVTTTPEDHHESDDLSNWGSERSHSNRHRRTISDDKQRLRRVSAPSSGPAPFHGASSRMNHSRKSREGISTSVNRRVGGGTSTKEGRIKPVERDINGDSGPAWNASTRKSSMKGIRRSQGHSRAGQVTRQGFGVSRAHDKGGEETARIGGRQDVNRLGVKRASLGSVESIPTSISGRGTGVVEGDNICAGSEPGGVEPGRGSKNALNSTEDDDELCSAAPSQDEIRVMIERIRLKTKDVPFDRATGFHPSKKADVQTLPSGDQMGTEAVDGKAASCNVPTSVGGGSGAGGDCRVHMSASDPGALDMVEIEEEERRLREKASVLQSEMCALKKRRLEVRLVKVEQQLKEEAGSRLLQRESKVRAAVESACIALRKERDERVKEVAAIKQDLKNKLDELSTMYEEVSVRLEHLKEAFTKAEDELRERANNDQRKALEREDRGIRRRMRVLMNEHGTERSKERLARREAQGGQKEPRKTIGEKSAPTKRRKERLSERSDEQPEETPVSASDSIPHSTPHSTPLPRGRPKAPPASEAIAGASMERREVQGRTAERRRSVGEGSTRSLVPFRRRRRVSGEM